jgi:tetratricopeptide (TPR) repeat protein
MLFPAKPVAQEIERILREGRAGRLSEKEAGEQLLAIDPSFAPGYALLASAKVDAGDLEAAEALAWKALDLEPCHPGGYLFVGDIRQKRNPSDPTALGLLYLAIWKVSFSKEVLPDLADSFRRHIGGQSPEIDFSDPFTYELLAGSSEKTLTETLDADAAARLLPYRLLNDIQRQASLEMDEELLEKVRVHAGQCASLLHSALRDMARWESIRDIDAACMIAALLGEIGGPECFDDLLEWSSGDDLSFLHGSWALWRLGQRFPAEAVTALRAAISGAVPGKRCAIAEHLILLGDRADITPALPELLEGFEKFATEDEAGHLLGLVAAALRERGRADLAAAAVTKYAKLLPASGRKVVDLMRGKPAEEFLVISDKGVDQFDLNEVCIDQVFMEDVDEDEEEEDDDAPPAVKPGRNDPCWCGSGKKYKKCHLEADEEYERQRREKEEEYDDQDEDGSAPAGETAEHRLFAELLAEGAKKRSDIRRAARMYFGETEGLEVEEVEQHGFFEWFVRDYRAASTGRTFVEEFLRRPGLPPRDRQILESWRNARFGLYEIQRIDEGAGVELKDLCAGDTFFVHDVTTSRERVKWDCMLSRVEELDGKRVFSGVGTLVPRPLVERLLEWIETERQGEGQSAAGFVRANSHRLHRVLNEMARDQFKGLHVVNAEGDPLEFCSAEYDVGDEAAVVEALRGSAELEPDDPQDEPGVRAFAWLEANKSDSRRSYGHIEIRSGRLRLECNSRQRLEKGRRLIEQRAGAFLRHTGDALRSLDSIQQQALSEPRRPKKGAVPPELEREIVLKFKREHYATWADEPLPALDGKTPRQAVKTDQGRQAVENLLRMMENGEERLRKEGGPAFDFTPIRQDLGLG